MNPETNRKETKETRNAMRLVLIGGTLLLIAKFYAWYITGSNGILTDALESIINVGAATFALYSISFAARPKDRNHLYGHGKIEYFAAGFEGALIIGAGISIIIKSVIDMMNPEPLASISEGTVITGIGGVINLAMAIYLVRKGKKLDNLVLTADGKHLLTDALTSAALVIGLICIQLFHFVWLDNVIAVVMALFILFTGGKLIRRSIAGLMDETDFKRLGDVIDILEKNRNPKWIDMHNLRIVKYGQKLHVDCHVTLPWYLNLVEAHDEVKAVEKLLGDELNQGIEMFLHNDPCLPDSCPICTIEDCDVRQKRFDRRLEWTLDNLLPDQKHKGK